MRKAKSISLLAGPVPEIILSKGMPEVPSNVAIIGEIVRAEIIFAEILASGRLEMQVGIAADGTELLTFMDMSYIGPFNILWV